MSSFRAKFVYFISFIAIVVWLGICAPAIAVADLADGTISVPEPSLALLSGLGIAGIAVLRWLKKR